MRRPILLLVLPLLAACSTTAPLSDRLASRDVPCLRRQVLELDNAFKTALSTCGVAKPDLTGNSLLQQAALDAKIPFTIRPHADAYLKQAQNQKITGSLFADAPPYSWADPKYGGFSSSMPLSDGH